MITKFNLYEVYTPMIEERNSIKNDIQNIMKDIGENFIYLDLVFLHYKIISVTNKDDKLIISTVSDKEDKFELSSDRIRFDILEDIVKYLIDNYPDAGEKHKVRKKAEKYNI